MKLNKVNIPPILFLHLNKKVKSEWLVDSGDELYNTASNAAY
jgi:hypothetical protein